MAFLLQQNLKSVNFACYFILKSVNLQRGFILKSVKSYVIQKNKCRH